MRNSLDRIGTKTYDKQQERGQGDSEIEEGKEIWDIFDDTDFYHQILRDVVDSRKDGNGEFRPLISLLDLTL
jgi:hypothetical protein